MFMLPALDTTVPTSSYNYLLKPRELRYLAMSTSILLITDNPGQPWNRLLDETISSIGLLVEAGEQTAMRLLIQQTYDLVLIDGSVGSKLALLVARVRALRPESTIVVATADPEWMSAREVLQAGAVDY